MRSSTIEVIKDRRHVSLTPHEAEVKLFCFWSQTVQYVLTLSVYMEYKRAIHTVPRDSLLSLSGRTCTCRWILLHSSVDFNHMICFCFLSSRCHGNLVYGCPEQQVKHRTPKQKGEFPIPSKQECFLPPQFFTTEEKQHAVKKKKNS